MRRPNKELRDEARTAYHKHGDRPLYELDTTTLKRIITCVNEAGQRTIRNILNLRMVRENKPLYYDGMYSVDFHRLNNSPRPSTVSNDQYI